MNGEAVKPGPHKIQGIGADCSQNLDMSMVDKGQVTNDESIAMACAWPRRACWLASPVVPPPQRPLLAEQDAYAGKTIVVVLPDLAERYLSSVMFADVPTGIIEQPVAV